MEPNLDLQNASGRRTKIEIEAYHKLASSVALLASSQHLAMRI